MNEQDAKFLAMENRIRALEMRLAVAARNASLVNGPFQRLFLVKPDADNAALFHEQTVAGGEIVEFTDGRRRTDDTDDFGLINPAGSLLVMEFEDIQDGSPVKRYVNVGGDFVGYYAVTGSSQNGSNKRYVYSMRRQEKTATAYDGWTDVDPVEDISAFNDQEEGNSSTGLFGNGVNSTNITGGLAFKPAPTGKGVHRVYAVTLTDGTVEYWFSHANAIDGSC